MPYGEYGFGLHLHDVADSESLNPRSNLKPEILNRSLDQPVLRPSHPSARRNGAFWPTAASLEQFRVWFRVHGSWFRTGFAGSQFEVQGRWMWSKWFRILQ